MLYTLLLALAGVAASTPVHLDWRRETLAPRDDVWYKINGVRGAMLGSIRSAWEQGTSQDGIIEIDYPELSIFGSSPYRNNGDFPVAALQLAASSVVRGLPDGQLALGLGDTNSQLDTCSPGQAVLLGSVTDADNTKIAWQNRTDLLINFMLHTANRTRAGALSHRSDVLTYWSDGCYMSTSFLSVYGYAYSNKTVLDFAFNNLKLYRDALYLPEYGLLGHIRLDQGNFATNASAGWTDKNAWATGNAWWLGGLVRLKAAILQSSMASEMTNVTNVLRDWCLETMDALYNTSAANEAATGSVLVLNWANVSATGYNEQYNATNFGDSASSAVLVWASYRLAVLDPPVFESYIPQARVLRQAVQNQLTPLFEMGNATNVLTWNATGVVSTESQAFYLLQEAAAIAYGD